MLCMVHAANVSGKYNPEILILLFFFKFSVLFVVDDRPFLFFFAIILSDFFRLVASDYPSGIFKHFLCKNSLKICSCC